MTTQGQRPVRFALIGAGRIGTHHATALARHVPDADLVVVADPFGESADRLAGPLGADSTTDIDPPSPTNALKRSRSRSTSTVHADLVQRAAAPARRSGARSRWP